MQADWKALCCVSYYSYKVIELIYYKKVEIVLPKTGPKATTKSPLPTICKPKAAGSFSRDAYSDMVMVKLIRAAPLTNPHITSQIIIMVQSLCSAITVRDRDGGELEETDLR